LQKNYCAIKPRSETISCKGQRAWGSTCAWGSSCSARSSSRRSKRKRRGAGSATCSRRQTRGARSTISPPTRQLQGRAHEAPGQRARGCRQGGPAADPCGCVSLLLLRQSQHHQPYLNLPPAPPQETTPPAFLLWGCATGAASLRTAPDMHPPTPDDLMMLAASRTSTRHRHSYQHTITLPTYNNASRTRHTPPTPDDASRMQYSHKTRWPWSHSI